MPTKSLTNRGSLQPKPQADKLKSILKLDRIPYSIKEEANGWYSLTYYSNWLRRCLVSRFSSMSLAELWVGHLKEYGIIDK